MGNETKKCYFTGITCLPDETIFNSDGKAYYSKLCGRYKFYDENKQYTDPFDRQKTACYLFYNKITQGKCYMLVPSLILHLGFPIEDRYFIIKTEKDIENWYPKTFAEKTDKILLYLAEHSNYDGEDIKLSKKEATVLFFMYNDPCFNNDWDLEFKYYLNFFAKNGYFDGFEDIDLLEYVDAIDDTENPIAITLSPKALERVYELQKTQVNNSRAFVAMQFGVETEELRKKIKKSIQEAGYEPVIMDEVEHNHQIVPEMLYQIRNSKFVIAELSHHNNGAYYEAGYALGLGKEVIHICKESELKNGLHFDVAQVNTIVYETIDDLPDKIVKRIKATIG